MPKGLIIVESPAKAKTIAQFVGQRYAVVASKGHVRDLPRSQLGVDVEHDFKPKYITIRGKGEVVSELRDRAKRAGKVLLATDPDREGEAISWHLAALLGLNAQAGDRVTFHEITRDAVARALGAPRPIDQRLVDAQQARRVLDRLVGYLLSPLLWKKVRGGLSAGRVQSVAVRLICDREAEIQAFQPREYWTLTARLRHAGLSFEARYRGLVAEEAGSAEVRSRIAADERANGARRGELSDEAAAAAVLRAVQPWPFVVGRVQRRERHRNPVPPFTTASLQQEAARKLGYPVRKTMRLAQELYEGLDVGGQHVGLVTYIRTDSTRVAAEAVTATEAYVRRRWGGDFAAPRTGQARAGAQDAHEAIRPTDVERAPESLSGTLGRDQLRLYRLIWERFVASQMTPAVLDTVSVDLLAGERGEHAFRATGSTVRFKGFMVLYVEGRDDPEGGRPRTDSGGAEDDGGESEERRLPELQERDVPALADLDPRQHFTEPPPRFTEAMLVRTLEERGIGRPSTYAPIIETVQTRGYVEKEDRRFFPTELGVVVVDLLRQFFPRVVDVEFTAGLEGELDRIEAGEREWRDVVAEFYGPFAETLKRAEDEIGPVELPAETTDEVCEMCGRPMVVKHGRYGAFLACSGYPDCRSTRPILEKLGIACPKCGLAGDGTEAAAALAGGARAARDGQQPSDDGAAHTPERVAPVGASGPAVSADAGELVVRRSRKGRVFYGCSRYPACDFVAWDRPTGFCPVCGHLMTEHRGKRGGRWTQCTNAECGHREQRGDRHLVAVGAHAPAGDDGDADLA